MQFKLQNAPSEKLEKTRALLNVHRLGCGLYRRLGQTAYYDGQPVEQVLAQTNQVIEQINTELARRGRKVYRYYLLNRPPTVGTYPPHVTSFEVWTPSRRIPEQPADHDRHAHGWVEYAEPLSEEDIHRYDLWHVGMLEE